MHKSTFLILVLAVSILVVSVQPADAIPAFARKYKMSCSTCHAPFPKLKPYGNEFAGRGFRMEPNEEPTRATYDVGDPLLLLNRDFPLAIRVDGYVSWKEDSESEIDVEFPWAFKVLSGGPIGETVSYYVYFILEKGDIEGLEDAYLQFNAPFKMPFDLMFGQFQVCDPMFKREARLERFDYEIFKTRVGYTKANLTYDRGILFAFALPGEIDSVLQIVNGYGIDHADDFDNFDRDKFKNFSLHLGRQFGPVHVGVFGYYGKEKGANPDTEDQMFTNKFFYVGPDIVVDINEKVQFSAQYLLRNDDDPWFTGNDSDEIETSGGFAEITYYPQGPDGRWVLSALYNKVESDDEAAELQTISLTMNYLIARNVRFMAEVGQETESEETRISLGVITAF